MRTNKNQVVKTSLAGLMVAAFLCAGLQQAKAAVLANYNFNSSNGTSSDSDTLSGAGTFAATGITTTYGTPSFGSYGVAFRADSYNLSNTRNNAQYYSFTITPTAGYMLNLGGNGALTFDISRNAVITSWTFSYAVRCSLDGYASDIATGSISANNSWVNQSVNLSSAFNSQAGGVTFRIVVWDNATPLASGYNFGNVDNVILNGTVAPVPEPVNTALGVFGLCVVGVGVGRRYLRNRS